MCRSALAILGALLAAGPSPPSRAPPPRTPAAAPAEVTFFVAADTHLGASPQIGALNRKQVEAMNALPGKRFPWAVGPVTVARPRGVFIAGDLTDHGLESEWKQFAAIYGRDGNDGLLAYPVLAMTGNHDRHLVLHRPVLAEVTKRHGALTYSRDWGDVHIACVDEAPRGAALAWLRQDLEAVGHARPVVLIFHYNLVGPFSTFWTEAERTRFAEAIEGYNVVGIFHGHYHKSEHYRWKGWDVYNVGSPRHAHHSFAVVRIAGAAMIVASWDWDRDRWQWWHAKRIRASPVAPRTRPAASRSLAIDALGAQKDGEGGPDVGFGGRLTG